MAQWEEDRILHHSADVAAARENGTQLASAKVASPPDTGEGSAPELAVVRSALASAVAAEAYEEAALLKRRLGLLQQSIDNRTQQAALQQRIAAAVAAEAYSEAAAFKPELVALRQRDLELRAAASSCSVSTAIGLGSVASQ